MNTTMPWSLRDQPDSARRAWPVEGRIPENAHDEAPGSIPDHAADMAAIAAELSRLQGTTDSGRPAVRRGRTEAQGPIRDAVAEIARRQADLDRHGEAPTDLGRIAPVTTPTAGPNRSPSFTPPRAETAIPAFGLSSSAPRRSGTDLSAEVAATFARFSQELHAAIKETDARPKVEELGRQVTRLGEAVQGLTKPEDAAGSGAPATAEPARAVPLEAVERQVAALEARLGKLATLPVTAPASAPDLSDTLGEVRRMLEGLDPRATMTSLENRLDDITARLSRGFRDENPAGLIENLGRRVDEIHASLRSQLAQSAVDTRPLEGLVRGLSDRLGQARAASADFEQLETAMREIATRIETAGSDPRAIQAIEAQFARLAERLDRSETSLKALDGVEQALGELFSQFEVTRQVAIDAAETAARTAARDTLRAALQNPALAHRGGDTSPGLAEQVARGLDDLRALQHSSEQRTQSTLSDMRALLERFVHGQPETGNAPRTAMIAEESRRRRPPAETASAAAVDPTDLLIEPGLGRNNQGRSEPRFGLEPVVDPVPAAADPEGPAGFIAAARRAAQAAQASAASAAALKDADRSPPGRAATARRRRPTPAATSASGAAGALVRTKEFLARRRRPILLGLAAIVLLVGALEVVKLGLAPSNGARVETSGTTSSARTASLESPVVEAKATAPAAEAKLTAPVAEAVLPPVAAPNPPPLPTFVAGATKAPVPADGISEGLRSLAASGDAGAQYEVGLRYAEGRGVARDPRQALAWFDKAAAQGLAPAQYRMGSSYEKGIGVDRDPALAMAWYAKAAGAGNIRAMHNLAVMSAEGAGSKPDYAKAAQWFGKASTYGVRDSQFNLAILYARGLGIEQSLAQSYKWFSIAAAQGDEDSAKKRDEVAAKLDPAALAAAKASVEAFRVATPIPAANEVTPPVGGWDGATPRPAPSAASKVSQL